MGLTGIIAEFNPLHNGHKMLIDFAKQKGDRVACAISGNFVQRGDVALVSKQKRAEFALLCGADIVCEIPVLWSMSTAQNFALCGVWQLYNLGCDTILFGSECGEIESMEKAANILLSDEFSAAVSKKIKEGVSFASARESCANELGVAENILSYPNNNLGVEYILAAKKLKLNIKFETVKRVGQNHDSMADAPNFVSSSFIREKMISGDIGYCERFMPMEIRGKIAPSMIASIKRIDRTILGILRTKTEDDFKNLPDLSEGIENKLLFSVRVATSLDELCESIKSKRYTLSRVRRLVLSAVLSFDKKFFMTTPPYVRVFGFSKVGEELLKNNVSLIPVVTRVSAIKELDKDAQEVFKTECLATDIFALCFESPLECGLEYKYKLQKTE
ncbi:MAG: nucleotidyltransferase family protein [Clostridia bacterium]|nr:nucleotidyltransferase family protein [Clostridia bacterium]